MTTERAIESLTILRDLSEMSNLTEIEVQALDKAIEVMEGSIYKPHFCSTDPHGTCFICGKITEDGICEGENGKIDVYYKPKYKLLSQRETRD